MCKKRKAPRRRLGLIGWIKARLLERKLRKQWKQDRDYRDRIYKAVEKELSGREFTFKNARSKPADKCVN